MPAPRFTGNWVSTNAQVTAPTAKAECNSPSPLAPRCKMSVANTGNKAVAPPKSTANRSSVMAPKIICRFQMKRAPAKMVSKVTGARLRVCWVERIKEMASAAMPMTMATVAKAKVAPKPPWVPYSIRKPPSTGPMMVDTCWPELAQATALGKISLGTRLGISAKVAGCAKERPVPIRNNRNKTSPMAGSSPEKASNMTAATTAWKP